MNPKQLAGELAADYAKDGMVVGLGTGSTVFFTIHKLGELVKGGMKITGIPTSLQTETLARELSIPLSTLDEHPVINVTIDGADEVDPKMNLIKGLGGALFREKVVAGASKLEVIVVDGSKVVDVLGTKSPLPVEIVQFGYKRTLSALSSLGCHPALREKDGRPFVSDNGNYIADCRFDRIDDPAEMEKRINLTLGVVENGLFVDLTDIVIVGGQDSVEVRGLAQKPL